jgi:tetratricopeptide (TPR) repeat protein
MLEVVRGNHGFHRRLPNPHRTAWAFSRSPSASASRLARRLWLVSALALVACAICPPAHGAAAQCKLGKLAEFATTMMDLRPLVAAKIEGTNVRFLLDSGAFYSMISPASAAELKLRTYLAPAGLEAVGIGGSIEIRGTRVNLELNGIPLHDVEFIVGGNDVGADSVGLLGRNIIQLGDAEFDLSRGLVRLMVPRDCGGALLAYWVRPGEAYSVVDMPHQDAMASYEKKAQRFREPIIGVAYVNGVPISAIFDTGAQTSFLTVKAAARAGIKLDSPGVVQAGFGSGIGRSQVRAYIAPVSSFKIGDEEIRNTRLRLVDTALTGGDMLLGADFFLSHHIYVANSQRKVYFTYNGGPVFNLAASSEPSASSPAAQGEGTTTETATPGPSAGDAGEYARRGEAFASRREFDQALLALTRACELAPDNSEYFYQRGVVYRQSRQLKSAQADFDRAIELKPDYVPALLARSDLRIGSGDKSGAAADLKAANAVVPKEDALHFSLGGEYARLRLFPLAIEQFDLWIASHPLDVSLPAALNWRCRARALAGIDLQLALEDCNKALKHAAKPSPLFASASDSRGLVLLRLGNYDKSIADYDAALKIEPRDAWSLYGRGIDKIRVKKSSEGLADIEQAKAISPDIAESFGEDGVQP